jgi:hypothetical protein
VTQAVIQDPVLGPNLPVCGFFIIYISVAFSPHPTTIGTVNLIFFFLSEETVDLMSRLIIATLFLIHLPLLLLKKNS